MIDTTIASRLGHCAETISSYNMPGNLGGSFAYHILKAFPDFKVKWQSFCTPQWMEQTFDKTNVYHIACLGYSLHTTSHHNIGQEPFREAFYLLKRRDHFKGSHLTFPFQPVTFLGLVLGCNAVHDENWQTKSFEWLRWIFDERQRISPCSDFQALFYSYIQYYLLPPGRPIRIPDILRYSSVSELSFLEYGLQRNIFQTINQLESLGLVRENLLKQLIISEFSDVADEKATLIWAACSESIAKGVDNVLLSPSFVSSVLSRFEDAMRRWRYDPDGSKKKKEPIKWPINEEREVQDILWLILRSYFDDLIDEETLPKLGHSSYRPDFAIPSLGLLIEAKVAYKKDDFKKIEKAVMEDSVGYLINTRDYDKIIVFIYDKSVSIQEHNITKRALLKIKEIQDVIIASKPSMLP